MPSKKLHSLLLIEDDSDLADVMIQSLFGLDIDITHVTRAGDGVNSVDESRPDILVLDLGLPDFNGCEVITQLRDRGFSDLPLIIYTVRDRKAGDMEKMKLGRTHYLTKSQVSLGELRTIIADIIQGAA
ncbi:response regulator [Dehalococcoides mccartyi]|nr:response regulator [Dehalococcoides mccartyi]